MKNNQIDRQLETIDQITSILKKYKSVTAVALMGSHSKNTQTAFSDIDFLVVFENDERKNLKKIFDEAKSIKPTLSTLYQLYDKESLILYEDGVRLDLTLEKRTDFNKWVLEPVKILFDTEGIFEKMLKKSQGKRKKVDKVSWNKIHGSFVDWFFWMFRQIYCYACQSELVKSKSFEKKMLAVESMQITRNKLLDTLYFLNGERDYLVNIDKKLNNQFLQTFQCNSVKEIKEVVRVMVDLYENIIGKYCKKEKIHFPDKKVNQIKNLFSEFDDSANFPIHP